MSTSHVHYYFFFSVKSIRCIISQHARINEGKTYHSLYQKNLQDIILILICTSRNIITGGVR